MKQDPIIKAKELIELIKFFRSIKAVELPRGMKCPFDVEGEVNHYELSEAAFGLGLIRWDCLFCGKHFEE